MNLARAVRISGDGSSVPGCATSSAEVLERERLYVLALRTKPAVNALVFHQAAELFNQQFPNLQVRAGSKSLLLTVCTAKKCLTDNM